jgi:EAL domain-containing protein (putative c-di-GMP-specific phosphodiesterase class I)/CheY-like chemotaxis protein
MRRAREQGRGRLQFFAQEMNARASERLRIRTGLARALERGELRLHYQPVVDLRSGRVHQVEALLRWQSPDGMFLVPAEFIAIAEETGLVSAIGEWVLEQACRQARLWRERHDPELQVAVNVSSVQVRDGTLLEAVRRALRGSVLPPEALEIGVSASHFLSAADGDSRSLKALKGLGVTFAIDDFGTQYAGLGFMRHLQVDRLKVGQSFIREITTDAGYAAIVRAIISMAHGLGMKVSAGGVTTAAQLNYLRKLNCDEAQGHYFGPAVPAQEMEQQLAGPVRRFGTEPSDRTLLLVDDEANVLSSLRRALQREGYRILTASSAREALELLATEKVGVIVSDQRMPEMTGTELLGRVKLMYPRVVRIVLSGHTDLATITDAVNRGAVYKFLTKPWEHGVLRDTLREAFERHECADRDDAWP